jgi:twitching motility protein PilT
VSVVLSLLRAIDRADGEALVMHVGEKPYVVTATGHAELAAKALTIPAMTGMLDQLLPSDSRQALDELGAVEYHLPPQPGSAPDARYSVVAARGGDDIWIEVRRRKAEPEPVQEVPEVPAAREAVAVTGEPETYVLETSGPITIDEPVRTAALEAVAQAEPVVVAAPEPVAAEPPQVLPNEAPMIAAVDETPVVTFEQPEPISFDEASVVSGEQPESISFDKASVASVEQPEAVSFDETSVVSVEQPEAISFDEASVVAGDQPVQRAVTAIDDEAVMSDEDTHVLTFEQVVGISGEEPDVVAFEEPAESEGVAPAPVVAVIEADPPATSVEQPVADAAAEAVDQPEPPVTHHLAPVVPMAPRAAVRLEPAPSAPQPRGEGLPHLLQVAAAHGASVLYVAVQAKPSLRVDGEIRVLEHETPLSEAALAAGLKAVLGTGATTAAGDVETCDVPGVGRVQCLSFRDHRGVGAMFKMLPARAISSEQMGLGAPIHALCTETEGLVLVAGARGAGKSTLVAALVDQMNRTRRDHVITVEQQIQFVHENRQSFVSQREARDDEAFGEAVRAALREGPDVLVVDQVASAEAAEFALNAAAGGHLVIASITAATTAAALSRFMEFFGEDRVQARITLSEHLRGVITQSLLRKSGGGRAAAREVMVNVPSVAALIAEGETADLSSVLNGGRRVGMVPLNDALLALVQSGALDVREAYRKSPDQQELVGQLNRAGLDTTFAERLA